MNKRSTRDKVFFYIDKHNEKLEFISGKWFFKHEEINDINAYLLNLDKITRYDSYNVLQYNFDEPNDVENWINYYKSLQGTHSLWYAPKIARYGAALDRMFNTLPDLCYPLTDKQLIIIGVMLYRPEEEVLFITSGCGGSGKSTFGNIVKQLFENDVAPCSLSDLSNEFVLAEAIKHRLIYSDEISSSDLNLPVIKTLASKQEITANPKNSRPYRTKTQSALLFCCNKPPKVDVEDTGILRRIIYYFKNDKINKPDKTLRNKTFTFKQLMVIAAHAHKMIMKYNDDEWRDIFKRETFEQLMVGNTVYRFRNDESYSIYSQHCKDSGLKAYSEPKWEKIRDYIKENLFDKDEDLPF